MAKSSKDLSNLEMVLASAAWHRAAQRGESFDGWPEAPGKVLAAKMGRLADRGVFLDARGWLDTTADWRLPEAEKAAILAALAGAGHRFDARGHLLDRPEDVAEGKRKAKAAQAERARLRTCTPTTVADLIGKRVVLTMDAVNRDMEDFILYGRRLNDGERVDLKAAIQGDERYRSDAPSVWGLDPTLRLVVTDGK